jgi:hypothetical protein
MHCLFLWVPLFLVTIVFLNLLHPPLLLWSNQNNREHDLNFHYFVAIQDWGLLDQYVLTSLGVCENPFLILASQT